MKFEDKTMNVIKDKNYFSELHIILTIFLVLQCYNLRIIHYVIINSKVLYI